MYSSQGASSSSSHSRPYSTPAETYDYARNSNPTWFSKGSSFRESDDGYRYLPSDAAGSSSLSNPAARIPLNATPFFTSNSHGAIGFHPHHPLPSWSSASTSTSLSAGHQSSPHKSDLAHDASSLHHQSLPPTPPHPMAIHITPSRRDDTCSTYLPPPEIEIPQMESDLPTSNRSPPSEDELLNLGCSKAREKKHGCWMCHKSFDRPSTLRKHLLVHTGEKAFVCETCGRRFGVASNLNRHTKRCVLRPVNNGNAQPAKAGAENPTVRGPAGPSPLRSSDTQPDIDPNGGNPSNHDVNATPPRQRRGKRARSPSPLIATPNSQRRTHPKPAVKRRRRAPSPSHWIPHSLLAFNLSPAEHQKPTPVPLLPITPIDYVEERNSYDQNVGRAPYSGDWKGTLPGPGLAHAVGLVCRDMRKLGGFLTGRVRFY